MNKFVLFLICCVLSCNFAYSKDYVKLQAKEMKQAQKYNTTNRYFHSESLVREDSTLSNIKDPKLIKIGDYEVISDEQYKKKMAEDNLIYKKIESDFNLQKDDSFNKQAYARDFYQVYRIAERIIRANNLDFVDWRISITADEDFNAYSAEMNYININTGLLDTLSGNENALAFAIGHEMGHALLGHSIRKAKYLEDLKYWENSDNEYAALVCLSIRNKYHAESRKMEFAADTEGAKLIAKAGYNLSEAKETLDFLNTIDANINESNKSHPNSEHRLASFFDNKKYFMEDEWLQQGRYNIYNSKVLSCRNSSDRKSLVILKGQKKDASKYYHPENMNELYLRYAYKSYLYGEFDKAKKYFKMVLKENEKNPYVYLYLSYIEEELYKRAEKSNYKAKHLENARRNINIAYELDSSNKYIKEQLKELKEIK